MPKLDPADRRAQIEAILKAVAIRIRDLGASVIIQPHTVSGHEATSLIVGESPADVIHLHAAENVGVQAVGVLDDAEIQQQFTQELVNSKDIHTQSIKGEPLVN
jgi:hypothetical protein